MLWLGDKVSSQKAHALKVWSPIQTVFRGRALGK